MKVFQTESFSALTFRALAMTLVPEVLCSFIYTRNSDFCLSRFLIVFLAIPLGLKRLAVSKFTSPALILAYFISMFTSYFYQSEYSLNCVLKITFIFRGLSFQSWHRAELHSIRRVSSLRI